VEAVRREVESVWSDPEVLDLIEQEMKTVEGEELLVLRRAKDKLRRAGVLLPHKDKQELQKLRLQEERLKSMFGDNLTTTMSVEVQGPDKMVDWAVWAKHVRLPLLTGLSPIKVELGGDELRSVLKSAKAARTRQTVFNVLAEGQPENLAVLQELVTVRHRISHLLGYSSHAEMTARDSMLESTSSVSQFLAKTQEKVAAAAAEELSKLPPNIAPADLRFEALQYLERHYNVHLGAYDRYFTLENVLGGLQLLAWSHFQVTLKEEEDGADAEQWHSSVTKWVANDAETGRPMGVIYLDLFQRAGKPNYALTCIQSPAYGEQTAQMVLVTSIDAEKSSLPLAQVKSLFHEFGHCLHMLVGRSKYYATAALETPLDLAETPSMLVEQFAFDPNWLQHYTGMTADEAHKLGQYVDEFSAETELESVRVSALDQLLHTDPSNFTGRQDHWPSMTSRIHAAELGGRMFAYEVARAVANNVRTTGMEMSQFRRQVLEIGHPAEPLKLLSQVGLWE